VIANTAYPDIFPAWVPEELVHTPNLSHGAFRLLLLIQAYAPTSPGLQRFAAHMGITSRRAIAIQRELEDKGYITVSRITGERNAYTITLPKGTEA
jgi:DNA-binding MarR family transcriptional regulator